MVSVYKKGKNTKKAIPIADTLQPKYFAMYACPNSCKDFIDNNAQVGYVNSNKECIPNF